jgi:hypothetical protein
MIRIAACTLLIATAAMGSNFTLGSARAVQYGVHEVMLTGSEPAGNPFDTVVTVRFTAARREPVVVRAFYAGGQTWRARLYVSTAGEWAWSSQCKTDALLDGKKGSFHAAPSKLRGRLLVHAKNPRQWMTEDGRWFLNLNDTAYFLLSRYGSHGRPVAESEVKQYVRDLIDRGITSIRSFSAIGPKGSLEDSEGWKDRWRDTFFSDEAMTRLRLEALDSADERLRWLVDEYPALYVQLILFPRGSRHGRDDEMWKTFTQQQKQRVMDYMIARYAAFPQIFWLLVNDAHYGEKFPSNNSYAREAGEYFARHDPWQHPFSTGHARRVPFHFGAEKWATYVHLEEAYDLNANQIAKYWQYSKPVFLGEDRYEQDRPELDPLHMSYFQRRLFWSWLLAGGSANYGGRWWTVHPYSRSGSLPAESPWKKDVVFTKALTGLDSVRVIRDYFARRSIELSAFEPDAALLTGAGNAKAMRKQFEEFLIYHPNAIGEGREVREDPSRTARLQLNLSGARGAFAIEWCRVKDGATQRKGQVHGGAVVDLQAPWSGVDVVVRLTRR